MIEKKNIRKNKQSGTIYIQSTSNNTICTLTNVFGDTVFWTSAGSVGFKNSRKSTTYAAQAAAEKLAFNAVKLGFFSANVKLKGLGYGKESAVRALQKTGLIITKIEEITPIPHNGCRPPKKRRV
jgi:small subunit ribosomal protein S11